MANSWKEIGNLAEKIAKNKKHVLLIGPPGSGKTMIARRVIDHMKPLSGKESSEIRQIYRCMGLVFTTRPFRAPHHTISVRGMFGDRPYPVTNVPRFGEISLAHNGVIFMDDFPEFSQEIREAISNVLKKKGVLHGNVLYPANILLIGSMNLCPCGLERCNCTDKAIKAYRERVEEISKLCDLIYT